ncbi:MAG: hypothetical protein C4346_10375 [Chloroflexota bacterium]
MALALGVERGGAADEPVQPASSINAKTTGAGATLNLDCRTVSNLITVVVPAGRREATGSDTGG